MTLRQQIELLREISRRQGEDLAWTSTGNLMAASKVAGGLNSERELAATEAVGAASVAAQAAEGRATIGRLQRELVVWRQDRRTEISDTGPEHEALRAQWNLEQRRLHTGIANAKQRLRQLEVAGGQAAQRAVAAAQPDPQQEAALGLERQATLNAQKRLAAARRELAEERRLQAEREAGEKRSLLSVQEELALVESRLAVEAELRRAQQAQLRSVDSAAETLRQQVLRVRHEAAELKASLEQNQDTLRRL